MKRAPLLSLLNDYKPLSGNENNMFLSTLKFVNENPECFERSLQIGHVTASGWVVSPDRQMVLLMHHRKLDRWFQPGGHCDGDPEVASVALKEVTEETGVTKIKQVGNGIYDVDVHLIPANQKDSAHYHYDIRFLFEADPDEPLVTNIESREVRWVPVNDVQKLNNSESLIRMVRKLR